MSDNAKMVFAENLKAYLNSKGYTQLDLATYMNCSTINHQDEHTTFITMIGNVFVLSCPFPGLK